MSQTLGSFPCDQTRAVQCAVVRNTVVFRIARCHGHACMLMVVVCGHLLSRCVLVVLVGGRLMLRGAVAMHACSWFLFVAGCLVVIVGGRLMLRGAVVMHACSWFCLWPVVLWLWLVAV